MEKLPTSEDLSGGRLLSVHVIFKRLYLLDLYRVKFEILTLFKIM